MADGLGICRAIGYARVHGHYVRADATNEVLDENTALLVNYPSLFSSLPTTAPVRVWMCVLASGSGGNCTALVVEGASGRHVSLIDLGLSPRRTCGALAALGIDLGEVQNVYLTHLDADHWNPAWIGKLPARSTLVLHRRHLRRAERDGAAFQRCEPTDSLYESPCGSRVRFALAAHDVLGSSVFRFEFPGGRSLGFATDLGRVSQPIVDHLGGVTVLAIESNYCPELQASSPRPRFLKSRITNGSGHLSNQQCVEAVARIAPGEHVVLLHLSRQCNRPDRALMGHVGAPYRLTITNQQAPTEVVWVARQPCGVGASGVGISEAAARPRGVRGYS